MLDFELSHVTNDYLPLATLHFTVHAIANTLSTCSFSVYNISMDGISKYHYFLRDHKSQLVLSGIPEHFWPALFKKLDDEIFDGGEYFRIIEIDYEGMKTPQDPDWSVQAWRQCDPANPTHIFLIDHAWTFKLNAIKDDLRLPALLDRMCRLLKITAESTDEKIDQVYKQIWKYAHTYSITGTDLADEERVPMWYVLDELGSAITHSETANFRRVPFVYLTENIAYTLIYPIENVFEGDFVLANYIESGFVEPPVREAMLIPWKQYDHSDNDLSQAEPDDDYFYSGHITETLPKLELLEFRRTLVGKIKVYSEYVYINEYLTADEFEIVDNENEADVLWYLYHFTDYEELSVSSPNKFINQFPYEYVITVKDLLAVVARRCRTNNINPFKDGIECNPIWLPTTYNMKTELHKLVANYKKREIMNLDNNWICKPFNLARGMDTYITDNLNFLCRLPLTGPKIAQKYIENPVLFARPDCGLVKFDIRYIIILKSVEPAEAYVYSNFFLRFANKPFVLNNFDDYEQHFTVMNYNENAPLYRLLCEEFILEWSKQYSDHDWKEIETSIMTIFSELLSAATCKTPPFSIAKSPQSRALYAADVMLSWNQSKTHIEPKLLEVNWMPDCRRACEYYPNFYNDIFSVMFLDKNVDSIKRIV